jgi:hypothetical protein
MITMAKHFTFKSGSLLSPNKIFLWFLHNVGLKCININNGTSELKQLDPGSGIGFFRIPDPGSRIPDPKTIFLRAF